MRSEYVLYKVKHEGALYWRARFFWDEGSGKYLTSRNLGIVAEGKRERRREAEEAAEKIVKELKNEVQVCDTLFLSYLNGFWSPDSEYIKEQADYNKTPLSKAYIENNRSYIRLHISTYPPFTGLTLAQLSRKVIRGYRLWAAEQGKSGRLINQCLQTMRVAVRRAVADGDLPADPFYGTGKAHHVEKEKGVLTFKERDLLIHSDVVNIYSRLSVLLSLLCGMRRGEVRGLRWGDINDFYITICNNWVDGDGPKNPKRKGGLVQENTRTVPMPRVIAELLNTALKLTRFKRPDDFVIQSLRCKGVPVSGKFFSHALERELMAIGIPINEQKKRNLTFHSLRHSYVTLNRMKGTFTDLELGAIAAQTAKTQKRYSHASQVMDMKEAREKLEQSLLPALPAPAKLPRRPQRRLIKTNKQRRIRKR